MEVSVVQPEGREQCGESSLEWRRKEMVRASDTKNHKRTSLALVQRCMFPRITLVPFLSYDCCYNFTTISYVLSYEVNHLKWKYTKCIIAEPYTCSTGMKLCPGSEVLCADSLSWESSVPEQGRGEVAWGGESIHIPMDLAT